MTASPGMMLCNVSFMQVVCLLQLIEAPRFLRHAQVVIPDVKLVLLIAVVLEYLKRARVKALHREQEDLLVAEQCVHHVVKHKLVNALELLLIAQVVQVAEHQHLHVSCHLAVSPDRQARLEVRLVLKVVVLAAQEVKELVSSDMRIPTHLYPELQL